MFNISAVSLTFFSPRLTKFSISPVGIIFDSRRGKLNFVAVFWLAGCVGRPDMSRESFGQKGQSQERKRQEKGTLT